MFRSFFTCFQKEKHCFLIRQLHSTMVTNSLLLPLDVQTVIFSFMLWVSQCPPLRLSKLSLVPLDVAEMNDI